MVDEKNCVDARRIWHKVFIVANSAPLRGSMVPDTRHAAVLPPFFIFLP